MNKHTHAQQTVIKYENNPFILAFKELGKGFKINQNPVIALLVGGFILAIVQQLPNIFSNLLSVFTEGGMSESFEPILTVILLSSIGIGTIVMIAVNGLWSGFSSYVGTLNAQNKQMTVGQSTKAATSKFFSILAIQFITWLISFAWFLPSIAVLIFAILFHGASLYVLAYSGYAVAGILFVAGVFMSTRTQLSRSLAPYALFDGATGGFDAMSQSIALTKGRLIEMLGLSFACGIIPIINSALTPLGYGAQYLQLKVYKQSGTPLPKTHILSWLPIFLIVAAVLLAMGIGLLLLIAFANNR